MSDARALRINVQESYNKIAGDFHNVRKGYTWSWVNDFITSLPKKCTICDIGCGSGRNMIDEKYNFIVIDNCKNFIDICIKDN